MTGPLEDLSVWTLSVKAGDSAAVRERAAIAEHLRDDLFKDWLEVLRKHSPEASLVYIETCHRIEIYAYKIDAAFFKHKWLEARGIEITEEKYKNGMEALKHLCRVCTSLESEVLGETQITGQVREATETARQKKWLIGPLDRCIQNAFRISKKLRSQTGLGEGTVSVAHAAIEGLSDIFENFEDKKALVVGAGPMALQSIEHLESYRVSLITWVNRSPVNQEKHAHAKRVHLADYSDRHKLCWEHDIIVSATSSPQFIFDRQSLREAKKLCSRRNKGPGVFLDLGLPRNVDETIHRFDRFFVRNVDEFRDRASENLTRRLKAAEVAEKLLETELEQFITSWNLWEKGPLMAELFKSIEELVVAESSHLPLEKKTEIDYIVRGIYAKLMHRLVEEFESLEEASSSEILQTVVRAWRQPNEWQRRKLQAPQRARKRN